MTRTQKILALVDLRSGEGPLVGLVLLYTFCATTMDMLLNTTAYALFLREFNAQHLPYIYMGVSIGSVLCTTLYLQLSQRYTLAQMLLGKHLLLLLMLLSCRLSLFFAPTGWLIFSLPIWHGVLNVLIYIAFWNLVGRLFTLQQGKRLFGLFGASQQLASLLVGLLVPLLVAGLGTTNLLVVAIIAGGGAIWFLLAIMRNYAGLHTREAAKAEAEDDSQAPTNRVLGDPYVRLIFGMLTLFALGSYFIDNIFYNRLESYYPNEDQVAGFLGVFNGLCGGLSLLAQFFVANRLLRRYGVRAAVMLTPLLLLLVTLPFVLLGTGWGLLPLHFWLATGMSLTMQIMNDTDNTAANLLYQPLPAALRTRIQTLANGVFSPLSVGLAGILLLILTNVFHLEALQLAYVLLPIQVGWALAGRRLGSAYGEQVQQALRQRTIQGKQDFRPDRASLEITQQALRSPHPGAVLYALEVLSVHSPNELVRSLPALLDHPSVPVRLEALARLERLGEATALPAIYRCWQDDADGTVRGVALQALAVLGSQDYFEELNPYLTASDPQLRRSVMVGFLRSGELAAILAVGETLGDWIDSADPADRIFAAQVLGESGVTSFYHPLLKMLADEQPAVQRAALAAAAKLQHPKLWPRVFAALAVPKTRAAARTALAAGGAPLLPTLQTLLLDAEQAAARYPQRLALLHGEAARICGRLRSAEASKLLLPNLHFPNLQVRTLALQALYQCGYRADALLQPKIEQQIQAELAHAAWLLAGVVDLGAVAALAPVRNMLAGSLAEQRMRLFWWLGLLYGNTTMQRVRDAFDGTFGVNRLLSAEQRSYLLEVLDLSIAKKHSQPILSLLDELTPAQQYARLAADFPQPALSDQQRLAEIISSPEQWSSPWLRAVALYTAITNGLTDAGAPSLATALPAAEQSIDELLAQTVAWARRRLGMPPAHANTNSATQQGDPTMLLTIEKMLILKTIDIFVNTPDEVLVEVAALLKEIEAPAAATIFAQGEQGDSMYIIVAGEVEALDGERVFTRMGERQVFGEMALLDGEPRTATIRTTQPTQLLRLDQEPFYELMDDRIEIARGIIHVLLQRLRARTQDVNRLQAQLNALVGQ